jgi:hypothetical protein
MSKDFLRSMLMPVLPGHDQDLDRALANAIAVSRWLKAELHLIISGESSVLERKQAEQRFGPDEPPPKIHVSAGDLFHDILDCVRQYEIDLLMFGMNSIPVEEAYAQAWQGLLLQIAEVPVLICPVDLNLARLPVESLLVPVSGEPRISASLEVALRLANDVKLPVDLIHVTDLESQHAGPPSALENISEHFYHEYPKVIDQLIAQSSPYSGMRDKLVIRGFQHGSGCIADQILKCVQERTSCLLVLEWKGSLASGRASTIKSAMAHHSFPILLVREVPKQRSVLKVGSHFEAA